MSELSSLLQRSMDYLVRRQDAQGYWVGELESNATITAEYLFFTRLLGISTSEREVAIRRQLLNWQADGGWAVFYGGPPDLSTTIEAAVALQMMGMNLDDPPMKQALEVIHELGGLEKARIFTRIWLALLGSLSWDQVPIMPPELMFFPDFLPLNIYRFASWARSTIVPLLVVMNQPPVFPGTAPDVDPLYSRTNHQGKLQPLKLDASTFFSGLDAVLKRANGILRRNPWRNKAMEAARDWIITHQESDGGWGGIQPAMVNSTLALAAFPEKKANLQKGIEAIESFGISDENGFRLQSCVSPGWDTPWTMLALNEAGFSPDHSVLQRAVHWLLGQQCDTCGDWSLRAPGIPAGGWPFEFHNQQYPDTDDTALVLLALMENPRIPHSLFDRHINWLFAMQNPDGGWAAFDRENTTRLVEKIPFCDFGEVLDPSSADVTAHILELFARLGYDDSHPAVNRGLQYLLVQQEADGAWFGRWGVNYIYGTSAAMTALAALGFPLENSVIARAVNWFRDHQNADGGWGESCLSYTDTAYRGRGVSTASQTAWALMGLLPYLPVENPLLRGGFQWLVNHQQDGGTWDEPQFTGTGFPGDFYINYHEYRNYFPALALARAIKKEKTL